jgi:hypothetical protein
MDLPRAVPPARHNAGTELPLAAYGLSPGDEIKLFARVEDNDPAGAKGAESPIAILRIISQQDYERLVMTKQGLEVLLSKYEEARRRMEEIARQIEELQKELAKSPDDSQISGQVQKQIADLAAKMQREADEIRKSADQKLPFDIDGKMTDRLKDLADKLKQAAGEVEEFARTEPRPGTREAREGLEQVSRFCRGSREQYEEQTTGPLEELAKVYPLMEDQARFTVLYQRQKELADRLASLRGKDSGDDPQTRARMRDLESEQSRIREDLKSLLQDIEDHVQQVPDEDRFQKLRDTAGSFAAAVRESGASEAMTDAESGLAAFSGTRGADGAGEAERILARFLSKCQSMGQQGSQCLKFSPQLSDNLGNTVEQLLESAGMGLNGSGMGMAGSGYSAQMNSLDNVGLFGRLPGLAGGDRSGDGKNSRAAVYAGSGVEGNFESGEPGRVRPLGTGRAELGSDSTVPPQYRQRVGAYFERLTDEIGETNRAERPRR